VQVAPLFPIARQARSLQVDRPLSQHRSLARRRGQRGFTLLMAIGLIAMVTAAVLVTLRSVSTESSLQAHERRAREAFFAAEAGMAEARIIVQSTLGEQQEYDNVFAHMGNQNGGNQGLNGYVAEAGLPSSPGTPWYEVIPWTDYRMTRGTLGAGIDPSVNAANQELNGPDGTPIPDYPEPTNVRYRVFIVDDAEEDNDRTNDTNNQAWLVSVGEVSVEGGGQPYRTIIRSLVSNEAGIGGGGGYGLKRGGSSNTGVYTTSAMPSF
jgi:Tfp pilus assembly protein PilX